MLYIIIIENKILYYNLIIGSNVKEKGMKKKSNFFIFFHPLSWGPLNPPDIKD